MYNSLQTALDYIARHPNRYIFPVKAQDKRPLVKDNLDSGATNDPDKIKAYASRFPRCNWGVALRKSNLRVADVDVGQMRRLDGSVVEKQGDKTYDALDLIYGWPETETTFTPTGGRHYYFDGPHVMLVNGWGLNVDSPNYTIIPGCIHKSGKPYTSNGLPTALLPDWERDVFTKRATGSGVRPDIQVPLIELDLPSNIAWAIKFLSEDAAPSIEGQNGDKTLMSAVNSLRDMGISEERMPELLDEHYNPRCEPPWDYRVFEIKARSVYTSANRLRQPGEEDLNYQFEGEAPEVDPVGEPEKIAAAADLREQGRQLIAAMPEDIRPPVHTLATLADQWVFIAQEQRFYNVSDKSMVLTIPGFNAQYAEANDQKGDIASRFFKERPQRLQKLERGVFEPGAPRIIRDGDGRAYNLYTQPDLQPIEGDTTWWDEHLAYLFPDDVSRNHVLNWMGWLIQNLTLKPKHLLLIYGPTPGTGKSFLSHVLRRILHRNNVETITSTDLRSDFNGWASATKLVVIEELRARDRIEVARALHDIITEEYISVVKKGIDKTKVKNCFGIMAFTNKEDAIPLDDEDRRYFVVRTDAKKNTPDYYARLHAMLESDDAIQAVYYALANRDLQGYNAQNSPPETKAKSSMHEDIKSDLEEYLIDNVQSFGRLVTLAEIIDSLPRRLVGQSNRLSRTIASILRRDHKGVDLGPKKINGKVVRVWALGDTAETISKQSHADIVKIYLTDRGKEFSEVEETGKIIQFPIAPAESAGNPED